MKTLVVRVVDWIIRKRSPALFVMRVGALVLIASIAGFGFKFRIPGLIEFELNSPDAFPNVLAFAVASAGLGLVVFGLWWEWSRYKDQRLRDHRKEVIVIETRGLKTVPTCPLISSVPDRLVGHRASILLEFQEGVRDGEIFDPAAVLEVIHSLPVVLRQRRAGLDRLDMALVYGGLTPVPFTFLLGVLIDDEESIAVLDWDRHRSVWRELISEDDGNRFELIGLDRITSSDSDVFLAVSVSHAADIAAISKTARGRPIVELILDEWSGDAHWSDEKQAALGRQFLEALKAIQARGAKKIHLFLAAPNSVVFRFGRLYDRRNLPPVIVHQYQNGADPPHPWGVSMPVAGLVKAAIASWP